MRTDVPLPSRAPRLVKALLVGLPVGTVLLGIVAMVWYFQRDRILGQARMSSGLAKAPGAASLADRVAKLTGPVTGSRHWGDENGRRGLEAVASLVEGSLGQNNMGYEPLLQDFDSGGVAWRNILAEVRGQRNPTEVVEIRVSMDRARAGPPQPTENLGLAVALEVAQALVGSENRRTVRFVFLAQNRDPTSPRPHGLDAHRPVNEDPSIRTLAVIDLDRGDFAGDRFARPDGSVDFHAVLEATEALRLQIVQLAND